ncbi:RNAPII transcription regulator C-terminal-domain-containing protein [Scleroderma yunnanense]
MESIERHIRSWMASEKDADVDNVISVLSSGEGTLLDVVKALGQYLTAEDDALRTKGVQLLSLIIEGCPKDKLNRQAVHVLATFYCSKLEDPETITPALKGLSHLVKVSALASSDVPDILNALFTHVKMRVLVQSTRFFVFNIIDSLIKSHLADLKAMGDQFVAGYASLASGEKDPRNLLAAFFIARTVLTEFDISKHVDDYFDITFCYFPITFRPPPNDPYGISADDLKASLQYIFQPVDPLTEQAALDTLQTFVRVLQDSPALTDEAQLDGMDELVRTVCNDCQDAISEPEKGQAKAGMKILCSFLSISSNLASYAVTQAAENLVKIFHDPMEALNRASVIILLTDLLNSLAPPTSPTPGNSVATDSGFSPSSHLLLAPSKDSVLGLLTVGLKAPSTRLPAVHGLSALIRLPSALTNDEIGYIVGEVGEFVIKEPDEMEDVTTDVLSLLSSIAAFSPQHLATQILPPLFLALPDHAPPKEAHLQRTAYWRALTILSTLCAHPELFETFVIRLTTKLNLLCSPLPMSSATSPPTDVDEMEPSAAYAHAILTAIANTLSTKVSKPHPDLDIPKYINTLLPHLFRLCLEAAVTTEQRVLADTRLLCISARIIRLVLEASPTELQSKFLGALTDAYLNGQTGASTRQRNTMILYAAAHVPLRRNVYVTTLSMHLKDLVRWCSFDGSTRPQREAVSQLLASLVNKHTDDVSDFLAYQNDGYWSNVLNNRSIPASDRRHALDIWVSITRALLIRSHPFATPLVDKLFILLDDDDIDWDAAHALGKLATGDDVLTKRNDAVLKILYAQRYFNSVLPRILEAASIVTGSRRETAYLVALAAIINSVPKALYLAHMLKLIPLLIRGLDLDDPAIRVDIISTLSNTIDSATEEMTPLSTYASTLVLVMLKNSSIADMPDPRVRVAALKYLALLPDAIRYDVLHPYKARVLKELGKVLDDPKRVVRKEAVVTRYKYNG